MGANITDSIVNASIEGPLVQPSQILANASEPPLMKWLIIVLPLATGVICAWLGYKFGSRLEKKKHIRSLTEKRINAYKQIIAMFNPDDHIAELDLKKLHDINYDIVLIGDRKIAEKIGHILEEKGNGAIDDEKMRNIISEELIPMMRESLLEDTDEIDKPSVNWKEFLSPLHAIADVSKWINQIMQMLTRLLR